MYFCHEIEEERNINEEDVFYHGFVPLGNDSDDGSEYHRKDCG